MKTRKAYRCMKCEGEKTWRHGIECPNRKPQHAPPPFAVLEKKDMVLVVSRGPGFIHEVVAVCNRVDNARYIVLAVNSYERHAKALARIMSINGSTGGSASLVKEFKAIAEQALDSYDVEASAKAEGK